MSVPLTDLARRAPLRPGDRAPDFTLPAADRDGTVSLADFRGRAPVLLGLFRGTYCPFCRRSIARMGQACDRLAAEGVAGLAVVATVPENARFYFRFRPPRMRVAADPDFTTHRLFGVPAVWRADIEDAMRTTCVNPTGLLPAPLPIREASAAAGRADEYVPTATDREDGAQAFVQFLGQFLVDREGIVRWSSLEATGTDLSGLGQFPSDAELLTAVRALPR
jgi:peroxiredoxin